LHEYFTISAITSIAELLAQEVHHIKLLAQGGTNDYDNLRAVCCSCHSSITACDCGRWQRRLK